MKTKKGKNQGKNRRGGRKPRVRNVAAATLAQQSCYSNVSATKLAQQSCYNNKATSKCTQQHSYNNMHKKPIDSKEEERILPVKRRKKIVDKPAKSLLEDEDVRRWYENMYRSSVNSADGKLRRLNLFRYRVKTTPKDFARLGQKNPAKVEDILMDHMTWMEKQKYAPSYMNEILKAAKSWLEYNRVEMKRKIKVKNADMTTTLEDEMNPTPEQIMEILGASSPKGRVIVSLMAFAGIRPQVMGLADGSDGLRIGDLPELNITGKKISFSIMPTVLTVRAGISKTRNRYITFIPRPGCEAILGYLRSRIAAGEELGPESPLVRINNGWEKKGWRRRDGADTMFMCTSKISSSVRKVIKSVIDIRPYALRSYFDSQMLIAESNGCIPHAYRQFFMGHKGDMEARYTTNKGRLTENMREDMRRCYTNSEIFLYPHKGSSQKDKARMLRDMWGQQAAAQGLDISKIMGTNKEEPKDRPEPPAKAMAETGSTEAKQVAGDAGKTSKNKVISGDDELVRYLDMGWTMIQELANGRYIIQNGAEVGRA